jgi:hypothetical protein
LVVALLFIICILLTHFIDDIACGIKDKNPNPPDKKTGCPVQENSAGSSIP